MFLNNVHCFTIKVFIYIKGQTFIPSVAFPIIQDLSFLHLVILCPAYATVRFVVNQTVWHELAVELFKYLSLLLRAGRRFSDQSP